MWDIVTLCRGFSAVLLLATGRDRVADVFPPVWKIGWTQLLVAF
jgi:hypothetical protein